jgi:hypothetical protein
MHHMTTLQDLIHRDDYNDQKRLLIDAFLWDCARFEDHEAMTTITGVTWTRTDDLITGDASAIPWTRELNDDDVRAITWCQEHYDHLTDDELADMIRSQAPWRGVSSGDTIPLELSLYRESF